MVQRSLGGDLVVALRGGGRTNKGWMEEKKEREKEREREEREEVELRYAPKNLLP
jgi:hypothetical protein